MRIAGKKVVDARRKLVLEINPVDVAKGKNKDPGSCAAALAIRRQEHVKAARVHVGRTYVLRLGKWERYRTPNSLKAEIVAYDRGGRFDPGIYTLVPMPPTQQLGNHYGGKYRKNMKKRRKAKIAKIVHHITTGVRHTLAK